MEKNHFYTVTCFFLIKKWFVASTTNFQISERQFSEKNHREVKRKNTEYVVQNNKEI